MEKETGFWPAIKDFFFRAGDFNGVSSRSQYWWVFLAQFLLVSSLALYQHLQALS